MSMMDETPEYFIRNGKIYGHHPGSSYTSGGFTDYEPSYNQELCVATPRNINKYANKYRYLYNYDRGEYQNLIDSNFKDAYNKDIFVGDRVLFIDTFYDDRFNHYVKGMVVGFTKHYLKIGKLERDKCNHSYYTEQIPIIKRMSKRVVNIEEL